jgi:4-hydroxybenzoate-CoA ligase
METERSYNAAVDFVDRNVAEGRGAKIAFADPSRAVTYAEMNDAVARVGPMLARLDVESENRVALIMFDTVDYPIVFWGAIRAGIVPVLLNTLLTVEQYRYMLTDSRAKVIFASPALLPAVSEAAQGIPTVKKIVVVGSACPPGMLRFDELLAAEQPAAAAPTCADDISYWQYSSGTTGMPKGVMHVHTTSRAIAQLAGQSRIGMREDDVVFSAPKMFFAYGLNNSITCPMWVGATTVVYPDRPTPESVFMMMRRYRPTVFYAVPTLYASILADPDCQPYDGIERLRLCFSAGEPLPPQIGLSWKERFGLDICNGVGATEMGHLFLTNVPGQVDYSTSGVPIEGYEMRLVDDEGRDVPDGEIGELWVRCESSAAGYWNQREKTRRTFIGEWTRTGDKYERRPDGAYSYCGRTDDMFKVSGTWVSPFEVEAALVTHQRVLEAAVVPAHTGDGLIKPKAYVVLKSEVSGADEGAGRALYEELKAHVKRSIGPWKYPRWVEFVDALPKTATGKIQRYKLRDLAESSTAPEEGESDVQS